MTDQLILGHPKEVTKAQTLVHLLVSLFSSGTSEDAHGSRNSPNPSLPSQAKSPSHIDIAMILAPIRIAMPIGQRSLDKTKQCCTAIEGCNGKSLAIKIFELQAQTILYAGILAIQLCQRRNRQQLRRFCYIMFRNFLMVDCLQTGNVDFIFPIICHLNDRFVWVLGQEWRAGSTSRGMYVKVSGTVMQCRGCTQ